MVSKDGAEPDLTRLIQEWQRGDEAARDVLFGHLYRKLWLIASRLLRSERNANSISPTTLVHEGYLRIARWDAMDLQDRNHLLALFGRVARRIVIDHAKKKKAVIHGGNMRRVDFEESLIRSERDADEVLAVDEALRKLEAKSPRMGRIVELLYFVELTEEETANALGVSSRTVRRDWKNAKIRLFDELGGAS